MSDTTDPQKIGDGVDNTSVDLLGSEDTQIETEIQISTEILIMLFLLMLSITLGHLLKKSKHKYLQEAGLTTIIGMLCGLALRVLKITIYMKKISKHFNNLFMILLLPPIIFESGYNLQKSHFFRNIGTVMMYSFVGTFIAIFSTSLMLYLFQSPEFTLKECFAFGSLISATDPVSVLAIFKELDADVNLYAIVFGESIFNDAIGIVMYETVKKLGTDENKTFGQEIVLAIWQFTVIFIGSLVIGMVSALLVAYVQKRQAIYLEKNREQPPTAQANGSHPDGSLTLRQKHYVEQQDFNSEISMMILGPWISYLVADGLELSGIVAILTHGVFLNIYAAPNISKGSRRVLSIAYETIAYSSETLVFIFLGIGVFAFDHPTDKLGAGSVILAVVNFNIARFLNIMVTSFLVNKTRGSTSVVSKEKKFVMWIAGLRGAMAYALAMQSIQDYGESGKLMLSITLIYSIITILGVGSILNPILIKCNVTGGSAAAVADNVPQAQEASNESEGKRRCCQGFKGFINHFDQMYFSPIFIRQKTEPDSANKTIVNDPAASMNKTEQDIQDDINWNNEDFDTYPNIEKINKPDEQIQNVSLHTDGDIQHVKN